MYRERTEVPNKKAKTGTGGTALGRQGYKIPKNSSVFSRLGESQKTAATAIPTTSHTQASVDDKEPVLELHDVSDPLEEQVSSTSDSNRENSPMTKRQLRKAQRMSKREIELRRAENMLDQAEQLMETAKKIRDNAREIQRPYM